MPHPLLCVDDDDLELDKQGMNVFGVAVQTKTLYIPVCLDWLYYEGSGAREQWATEQKGALSSLSGVFVLLLFQVLRSTGIEPGQKFEIYNSYPTVPPKWLQREE